MPGSNARVRTVTDSAFTPSGTTATAGVYARSATNSTFGGVKNAYLNPSTNIWVGAPPTVTSLSMTTVTTGAWPDIATNIRASWALPSSVTLISGFDVYLNSTVATAYGAANQWNKVNGTILSNSTTSIDITPNNVFGGTYSTYVLVRGINGLNATSSASAGFAIAMPSAITPTIWGEYTSASNLRGLASYTAGTVQKVFFNGVLATPQANNSSSTYSYRDYGSLAENTAYTLTAQIVDSRGFYSGTASVAGTTTNTPPNAPSLSLSQEAPTTGYPNLRVINAVCSQSSDADYKDMQLFYHNGDGVWVLHSTFTANQTHRVTGLSPSKTYTFLLRQRDNHSGQTDATATQPTDALIPYSYLIAAGYWTDNSYYSYQYGLSSTGNSVCDTNDFADSPYPLAIGGDTNLNITAVKIKMHKELSTTYDLTSTTRKMFLYGPGGIGARIYMGQNLGADFYGNTPPSTNYWTGISDKEYTWYINGGAGLGYGNCDDDFWVQAYNRSGSLTSTQWGSTAKTRIYVTVYYDRRTWVPSSYYTDPVYGTATY